MRGRRAVVKQLLRMTAPANRRDKALFLRASRDINYVKLHGRRVSTALFNLLICRTDGAETRLGIVVGKRFGGAVRRNRAKRVFRELIRTVGGQLATGYSLLIFPKRDAMGLSFSLLREAWSSTLRRQGVLRTREG
jgi:ribonuclease P protein component